MKHLAQIAGDGPIVLVARHEILHPLPPALAHVGRRDRVPSLLAVDLDVREELVRCLIEEDRVATHAVFEERRLELRPDRVVTPFVLVFTTRMNGHAEGQADHAR